MHHYLLFWESTSGQLRVRKENAELWSTAIELMGTGSGLGKAQLFSKVLSKWRS